MSFRAHHLLLTLLLAPVGEMPCFAQVPFESSGTRALGMAGAFVAVADDSSATSWNPAGLSTLRFFDAAVEWTGVTHEEPSSGGAGGGTGWDARSTRLTIALPVLAFSYERTRMFAAAPSGREALEGDRQDEQKERFARAFRVQHFGVTLVQALGDAIVVGSTLRLVRGGAEGAFGPGTEAVDAALARAKSFDVSSTTHFDADIGVLAWMSRLRLGLAVRNLAEPEFGAGKDGIWRLPRQVRVGAAYGGEPAYGQRPWVVALDADLTTTDLPEGSRRSLAAGAERWWAGRRLGVRGGARVQTVGDPRPAASGGLSAAVRSGLLIEAQVTGGVSDADRAWSVAARVTF